ncbi:MAG: D-aminoacyl-tRNA deacylase [Candidatus Pacearchaeota archaeon]
MENVAFIYSKKDIASFNLYKKLKEIRDFAFYEINDMLFFEDFSKIKEEKIIFLSKHESKEKIKSICLHFSGNFDKAIYGGKDKQLSLADPYLLKNIFLNLAESKINDFNLTLEATHHGPLCLKQHCFVEIGSSKKEWENEKIAEIIANAISLSLENKSKDYNIAIGFGGNHYCAKFNEIEKISNFALSHICPKYAIDLLDYELFKQMIERTNKEVNFILIDKKGSKTEQREKIKNFLERYNKENKKNISIKLI